MLTTSGLADVAAVIGDPARASMLLALMDGRALNATELAGTGGVTPQTASAQLSRMTQSGLLIVEQQGHHRYHQLASATVAKKLEGMMAVAATKSGLPGARLRTGPRDSWMRRARTCYDHLAGRVAMALADWLIEREHVELTIDGGVVTDSGKVFLLSIGVDLDYRAVATRKRTFCRPCLHWSERHPHIAGIVAAAILTTCFKHKWIRRIDGSRIVEVTMSGRQALDRAFGFETETWADG